MQQEKSASTSLTENTNFNRSDAKGDKAKCGQRGVSEKLVMDGDKWYTVPDDDDDESEVWKYIFFEEVKKHKLIH